MAKEAQKLQIIPLGGLPSLSFLAIFRQSGRQEMRFPMFLDCKLCWVPLYLALSLLSRDKTHKKSIGA